MPNILGGDVDQSSASTWICVTLFDALRATGLFRRCDLDFALSGHLPCQRRPVSRGLGSRRIHRRHGERDLQDGRATAPLWCWACYRRPCPAQAAGNRPRSHAWWPRGSAKRWSSSQKSGGGGADQPHVTRRSISPLPVGQIAQTDRLTRFF